MRPIALLLLALAARAEDPPLPPSPPWSGESRKLAVAAGDRWATPFEKSGFSATPRYDETVAWLRRLVDAAPQLKMVPLGKSDEGRDIWMVVASKEGAATPAELREAGRPVLLAQAGIHPGEIDGKDAGMMLLRDMTVRGTKRDLLDKASLLFVPILGVDGHERFGRYHRSNQRGPVEQGWRTNSRNLNLNRDYGKLDTPEVRAVVRVLREWDPDLTYDIHVTDGADYQYDITWGYNGVHAWSPGIARILQRLDTALTVDLEAAGHVPGPLVFAVDRDMSKGNAAPTFGPRFSHGYGDLCHSPTILVENHSLKPFDQRVFGTYVLLESTLRALSVHGKPLREAIAMDRARRREPVPLSWKRGEGEPRRVEFLGIAQRIEPSPVTGGERVVWTGEPVTLEVPLFEETEPAAFARRPVAYWVPPAWREVIERLAAHGIAMEQVREPRTVEVEMDRVETWKLAGEPFEGRVRVEATFRKEQRKETFATGSVRVPTDQPLGDLAVLLLDPRSPDSFFQWGFFLEILQRTEYVEDYVMDPLAERMLEKDPELKAAYEKRLREDDVFRKDPQARLRWFYERSPYMDARWRLYPVGREG